MDVRIQLVEEKMKYEWLGSNQLEDMVNLMARCNEDEKQYIPFCSRRKEAILSDMEELLTYEDTCILGGWDKDVLKSIIALDVEVDKKSAEVVAFFIDEGDDLGWQHTAKEMFEIILQQSLPVQKLIFFVGKSNERIIKWLEDSGANFKGDEFGLVASTATFLNPLQSGCEEVKEIKEEYYKDFTQLHDTIFPNTYYSGEQIINRLNENNKVFVVAQKDIKGYCYAEKAGDTWGYIHFLGVEEKMRRRGIGRQLIVVATEWLLGVGVEKVSMTVEAVNKNALELYISLGYIIQAENKSYHYKLGK